jgi:anti-sigma B factor antagonist
MVDSLSLVQTWVNDVVVVEVSGDVDMASAPELMTAIEWAGREEPAALVVNLTGATFLSVAGMNLLLDVHREMPSHRWFRVVADGPATSRPLQLLGIDSVVALYPTLDAALADLA